MARAKLFIKSEKLEVVRYEMPNSGHWCSAANRVQSTIANLSPQDRLAKEILSRSNMQFEIVDLSATGGVRAWLRGVKNTPTLIVEGDTSRKYEGVKAISQYVSQGQN